jgi:hypothetical protein
MRISESLLPAAHPGPPAVIVLDTYPHEIRIRSDVLANLSATDLAAMIAHESGTESGWQIGTRNQVAQTYSYLDARN